MRGGITSRTGQPCVRRPRVYLGIEPVAGKERYQTKVVLCQASGREGSESDGTRNLDVLTKWNTEPRLPMEVSGGVVWPTDERGRGGSL